LPKHTKATIPYGFSMIQIIRHSLQVDILYHNRELDYHRETPDGPATTIVPTGRESWHFIITKEPEHEG
jgi:hypothetical protein